MGDLEEAVMSRVWRWNRAVTVREVLHDLERERSIAYTTVMTVMDNLHHKGLLRRELEGRAYRYAAVSTRAAYSAALMHEAWAAGDNPAAALVQFFSTMSPEQRAALRDASRIVRPEVEPDVPEASEATSEGVPKGAAEPAPPSIEQHPEPHREPSLPPLPQAAGEPEPHRATEPAVRPEEGER
jgi:predicted transcriptional regulator